MNGTDGRRCRFPLLRLLHIFATRKSRTAFACAVITCTIISICLPSSARGEGGMGFLYRDVRGGMEGRMEGRLGAPVVLSRFSVCSVVCVVGAPTCKSMFSLFNKHNGCAFSVYHVVSLSFPLWWTAASLTSKISSSRPFTFAPTDCVVIARSPSWRIHDQLSKQRV